MHRVHPIHVNPVRQTRAKPLKYPVRAHNVPRNLMYSPLKLYKASHVGPMGEIYRGLSPQSRIEAWSAERDTLRKIIDEFNRWPRRFTQTGARHGALLKKEYERILSNLGQAVTDRLAQSDEREPREFPHGATGARGLTTRRTP